MGIADGKTENLREMRIDGFGSKRKDYPCKRAIPTFHFETGALEG